MDPVLHDAVTLNHFAAANRLDVLEARHSHRPEPRWTEAIRDEIAAGVSAGIPYCGDVLTQTWLGLAEEPETAELSAIVQLQVGLNDGVYPPEHHRGEAEAIFFAERDNGLFATDDNAAYDFARRRQGLGPGRVIDTIRILQDAVAAGELSAQTAHEIANEIEDAGRSLRRPHSVERTPAYFE